jgi:DNA repair photolyase
LFAEPKTNPFNRHLILLTKSANVHYLEGLPSRNTVVSFSLNPQQIADIFEGRYPDAVRITPSISTRVAASRACERMGFETRWRIDPIIPIDGWEGIYRRFFRETATCMPKRITLGIYRQMGLGLKKFSEKWGLQPMPWKLPVKMEKDKGVHLQLPRAMRVKIYAEIKKMVEEIRAPHARPMLALCKEAGEIRKESGVTSRHCNCE